MSGSGKGDPATIFCGGLPWDVQENQLLEYFQTFGNVVNVDLKKNPDTGRSRGFGFITYDSSDTAKDVVKANGTHEIEGQKIDVKMSAHGVGKWQANNARKGFGKGSSGSFGGGKGSSYGKGSSSFSSKKDDDWGSSGGDWGSAQQMQMMMMMQMMMAQQQQQSAGGMSSLSNDHNSNNSWGNSNNSSKDDDKSGDWGSSANPAAMMAMMQMMQGGKDKDKGSRYTPY